MDAGNDCLKKVAPERCDNIGYSHKKIWGVTQ